MEKDKYFAKQKRRKNERNDNYYKYFNYNILYYRLQKKT